MAAHDGGDSPYQSDDEEQALPEPVLGPPPPVQAAVLSGLPDELLEKLRPIANSLDRRPLSIRGGGRDDMVEFSIFTAALKGTDALPLVEECVRASRTADRAVGSMVGMSVGDALGHPLEFITTDDSLPPYPRTRPHVDEERVAENGAPIYFEPMNAFRLHPGQWTDDNSMGLCLADTLLVHQGYDGSDARIRWYNWWHGGYNNAFRFDVKRYSRSSCGLGGNIAKSMYSLKVGRPVSPIFEGGGEDAGNGCIMRLTPAPLMYHHDTAQAEEAAVKQCLGTHPGPDAVAACRFMAYFIATALHAPEGQSAQEFIDNCVREFIHTHYRPDETPDKGMRRLRRLLESAEPPESMEVNWNWRETRLPISRAISNRHASGNGYNGYPISPGYFGAYSMDGLAMALWAIYHTDTFEKALLRTVNLLGDADSVGSVAGQMAGALYGYSALQESVMGRAWLQNLHQWDQFGETPLRGLLLFCMHPHSAP